MKHLLTFCLCAGVFNIFARGGDNEQRIKNPVESVVIYLDGAEITQSKSSTPKEQRNTIIITGISKRLAPSF